MADHEGIVGVNMESKYDSSERRIKLDNNPTWFGAPTSLSADLAKGNNVKIRVETQGNNEFIKLVRVLSTGNATQSKGGGKGGGKSGGLSKEEWAAKDDNIKYQSARNAALTALLGLVDNESIKLGTGKKREEAFWQHLDRITAGFYGDVGTKGAVVRIGGQLDEGDTVPAETPAEPDDDGFGDPDDDF